MSKPVSIIKNLFIKCESNRHIYLNILYIFIDTTNNLSKITSLKNSTILKQPISENILSIVSECYLKKRRNSISWEKYKNLKMSAKIVQD